jgi:hypothetical protein
MTMKKPENPYKGLVRLSQQLAGTAALQPTAAIGVIVSPPPGIQISYHGMILTAKNLWIDEYWLQGHTRTHEGHIVSETQPRAGGGGYAEFASHTHDIDNDYTDTETLTDTWHVGDHVLLIPILGDDNKTAKQFVVGMKLRRLDGNG